MAVTKSLHSKNNTNMVDLVRDLKRSGLTIRDCLEAFSETGSPYVDLVKKDHRKHDITVLDVVDKDFLPEEVRVFAWLKVKPMISDGEQGQIFINHYHCVECNRFWTMKWSSSCNDRCSGCHREFTSYLTRIVGVEEKMICES